MSAGIAAGDNTNTDQQRAVQEKQEQAKNNILSQILDQTALVRLSNLAAAKPEKAEKVEETIINMAKRGQIVGRMSDDTLKRLLEKFSEQSTRTSSVKFDRRRAELDSDDEDY